MEILAIARGLVLLHRASKEQMLAKFGDEYREYQRRVPTSIPRFDGGLWKEA